MTLPAFSSTGSHPRSFRFPFRLRTLGLAIAAMLPPRVTPWVLRVAFGYRIGKGVRIGASIIDVAHCTIGDGCHIGSGNVFVGTAHLEIGPGTSIGHLNVFRGGDEIRIGAGCEILRLNVVNSIRDPVVTNPTDPRFALGDGSTLTEGHKLDFTDRIEIGDNTVVAGRNSSFWTHIRQETAPITIGSSCYVGSETRFAPGSAVPDGSVVGMGAVVLDAFTEGGYLIAGVPARAVKPAGQTRWGARSRRGSACR